MSMPKGTPPRPRKWVQCSLSDFRHALNSMRNAKITLSTSVNCNQNVYSERGTVLARHYHYRKSDQCLIHESMRHHLPEVRIVNHEGSIYEGMSNIRLF